MPKLSTVLRVVAVLLVAGCVLELCARLDDTLADGAPLFGQYGYSAMLTSDGVGVVGKPYAHYRKWRLNAMGYRGPDVRRDRETVICIGASETFGFTESEGREYPRQLEDELNRRLGKPEVQVVNVAYAGQSIGAFSHRVDQVATSLRPRIAVIYPSPGSYFELRAEQGDAVGWVQHSPRFELRIRTKFFELLDTLPEWARTMRYEFHIWKETRHSGTIDRLPEENIDRFRSDLRLLLDHLSQNHVQAVLVTHATRFGRAVDRRERPTLIAWRRFTPRLQESGFLDFENRFNDVIRSEAHDRHLLLVDAAQGLSGSEDFADFAHFTDHGATDLAHLISDRLLESPVREEIAVAGNITPVLFHNN